MKLTSAELDQLVRAAIADRKAEFSKVSEPDEDALTERAEDRLVEAVRLRGDESDVSEALSRFKQLLPES